MDDSLSGRLYGPIVGRIHSGHFQPLSMPVAIPKIEGPSTPFWDCDHYMFE